MSASSRNAPDPGGWPTVVVGLSMAQLQPIVETLAGERVASFDIRIDHEVEGHVGIRAEKVIPTFAYVTAGGRKGEATVFVKREHEHRPGHSEEYHYRFLARHGAPVPRLFGCVVDAEGREALFLEYLDAVTDLEPCAEFLRDSGRFPKFLTAIARLNAIHPEEEYAARIRADIALRPGPPGRDWAHRTRAAVADLRRIREEAALGRLGPGLEAYCAKGAGALDRLEAVAGDWALVAAKMPAGLCIDDCYPHHTGWRRSTGELLVFDLEYVGLEPRFWDVAPWLGASDDVQPRCNSREALARHYLSEYEARGGGRVEADAFLRESRVLWLLWMLRQLGWYLPRSAGRPGTPEAEIAGSRRALIELMRNLAANLTP